LAPSEQLKFESTVLFSGYVAPFAGVVIVTVGGEA
jgi:hypothetical protein